MSTLAVCGVFMTVMLDTHIHNDLQRIRHSVRLNKHGLPPAREKDRQADREADRQADRRATYIKYNSL